MDEHSEDEESPVEEIITGAVSAVTFLVGFGLMFAGFSFFWVAFVIGFAGVLPMALGLAKYYQRDGSVGPGDSTDETEDALEDLRRRYARGELSDEEFDRRVERLLETESVRDAKKYAKRVDVDRERTGRERDRGRTGQERDRGRTGRERTDHELEHE